MKSPANGAAAAVTNGEGGEKKSINPELWQACAGPLVNLPAAGTHVVYFPQGHSEQVAASLKKDVNAQVPNYPNLPSKLLCLLHNVTLHADPETDEVYAQMTLQPVSSFDKDALLRSDLALKSNKPPTEFFCKILTASDTSTHGGFSVPRRAAEKTFPPLDFSMQPPAQELVARDLHDNVWNFRHIYCGQPKRHLLTTGWSLFVSGKRLFAGDSVLFMRDEKQQLLLGIRRASRQPTNLSSSVLSSDSMHIGILAAAAHAAANNSPFTVFYNPRASPSEFVIPLAKYYKPVVQVLEQSNAGLDNLSVDAGRTQVGVQGMEQGGEEGRVFSHFDMENTGEGSVHHVDRIVPPTIDENYNRREATEILVQPDVCASAFVFYGNHNAISTSQQENVAGDEGTTPAAATRDHTPGRYFEEFRRWLMSSDDGDKEPGEDEDLLEQRRKEIEMASSNIERFWNHVEQTNDGILKCVFCGHLFAKNTSISRIKVHLAGERGRGVRICGQVPKQVQEAAFLSMHGGNSCSPEELPHDTFQTIPRTEPVVQVLGQSNVELDNFYVGAERTQVEEEEDTLNNSGRVAQPGAGASSSGGLRHNRSETRGAPLLTGSTKLVGRAFEENRNVIWSWLTDDEVSIIGIYGMAGAGKTTLLKHICNELQRSPDIYYPVYWVTLSPDFSIHKLQNKIAKCIQLSFSNEEKELGLRAEKLSQKLMKKQRCWKEEELGRRAKELSQELMKKQRWILILDNLCNSFELNKVGIPVPFKRCKLIMTTRSEEVCLQMNSKYNVRVNPLPREESWTLWYLQGGFLCCQGQGRKRIEMARLKSGWTLLMTNLILEIASAGFDQLGYALVGMVLAFVALVLAAADLIHMPRKERTSLLPSFHRQSASTFAPGNPVGTIVEYFGFVGGVWQCFYSTVEYAYAHQKRDNPIKMCLLPFLFLSCVVISILIKKSYLDKRA